MVPSTALLLRLYREPKSAPTLTPSDWSSVMGAARRCRAMGHLGLRLNQAGVLRDIAPAVTMHFDSVKLVIAERQRLLRWELSELSDVLSDLPFSIVLLKGAAYELQGMPLAGARMAGDIDLLVAKTHLALVEARLLEQGWAAAQLTNYDERYYREWSHELPPMKHPDRGVEVDAHDSITPGISGNSDAINLLLKSVHPIKSQHRSHGTAGSRFHALSPVDQLVHVAVHTFRDSELAIRLREVMDFDFLYRQLAAALPPNELSRSLTSRAAELGVSRPVWWATHFSARWLDTPCVPASTALAGAPSRPRLLAMQWLADHAMLPGALERSNAPQALAKTGLLIRYHWQRMPPLQLGKHLVRKSYRRFSERK